MGLLREVQYLPLAAGNKGSWKQLTLTTRVDQALSVNHFSRI